jgi:hypothetical protein
MTSLEESLKEAIHGRGWCCDMQLALPFEPIVQRKKISQENRNQAYAFLGELGYISKEKVLELLCNLSSLLQPSWPKKNNG